MNCLCCGKPLKKETESGWHQSCIKHFFGTTSLPELSLNDDALKVLVTETVNKGYTVPGVQKKLSLHLISNSSKPRLTLVNYPTGYILKPPVKEYESLPESEQLVMEMADAVGISTVPHALIRGNIGLSYITKRVDRIIAKDAVHMLAMEDFCQLDFRLTEDKYRGSYERCAKIVEKHSSRVGVDMAELFIRLIFSFMVGNSDMHLKNFSLIETSEGSGEYVLAPAYDLLPVNVIMPEDTEQFAIPMNGKKNNLHRNDFLKFAEANHIPRTSAKKMIDQLLAMKPKLLALCSDSLLPEPMKERFAELIEARCRALMPTL